MQTMGEVNIILSMSEGHRLTSGLFTLPAIVKTYIYIYDHYWHYMSLLLTPVDG